MVKDAPRSNASDERGARRQPVRCCVPENPAGHERSRSRRRHGIRGRCAGSDGMSFPTILASGKRSAIVHGRASGALIPRPDSWSAILVLYSPLLFGPHAHRACRAAVERSSTTLRCGAGSAAGRHRSGGSGVTAGDVDEPRGACFARGNWPGTLPIPQVMG